MSFQPHEIPASAITAPEPKRSGPSPFVRALPFALNTAAALIAHQWHYQGGAHSIGDAMLTCAASAAALWSGHRLAAGRRVPSIALAATYGMGGALIGVAVINYTTAIAAAVLAWFAGNVVSYALATSGWTKRADRHEERAHEKDMLLTRENAKTARTRIKYEAQVAIARELAGAWAAEHATRTAFNQRYPSPVPLVEQIHIRPQVRADWDAEGELRMLTEPPRRELPAEQRDGIDLPQWLTQPHGETR